MAFDDGGDIYCGYRPKRRQGFATYPDNVVLPIMSRCFRCYPPGQQTACATCEQRATIEELHVTRYGADGSPRELIQFVTRCWAPRKKRCPVVVVEVPYRAGESST